MAKVTGTRWQPFKRRWEGLEKKKFAHGQSHGNPLGTVQTPMGEPSKEDVRTWPESRELAGNRSNADGKSLKRNCSHMAEVTGSRWEPFKRRWEGLEKKSSHMAKVTGTRWEPFKPRWESLQKKMFAHGQSHGNSLGTVQTPMGSH